MVLKSLSVLKEQKSKLEKIEEEEKKRTMKKRVYMAGSLSVWLRGQVSVFRR